MSAGWTGFKCEWYEKRTGKTAAEQNGPTRLLS
jgi:hypothetical protein